MVPNKDFTDKRSDKKEKHLSKKGQDNKQARKALSKSKKETQKALDNHRLGWTTRDGKQL